MERVISFFGVFAMMGVCWIFSSDRKRVPWRVCIYGTILQIIFCLLVLGIPALKIPGPLRFFFIGANDAINNLLDFTHVGTRFIFGDMLDTSKYGFIFAVQVLPTIILTASLMAVLYQIGAMQPVIHFFAWIMQKTLGTSGAETLSTSANIFVGQTEAPLVVKPFIDGMTRSELFCVMVGGMASIAGGVLVAFVSLLRDQIPDIAGHLIAASVLSGPATIVVSKILIPEKEKPATLGKLPPEANQKIYENAIDAAAGGALEGMQLAFNVAAMLLAFIALIALANAMLGWAGDLVGFGQWGHAIAPHGEKLSMQLLLGWVFAPFAFAIGVPWHDVLPAAALLGEKTVLNEFVAYVSLSKQTGVLSERTLVLLSYALCGFANFSSIAIQVGGIGGMAPRRRGELARMGLKAVLGGTLSALMAASVVGMFL